MRSEVCLHAAIAWLSWISSLSAGGDLDAAADRSVIEVKNPLADPTLFPIAVWLQDPNQAGKYIEIKGLAPRTTAEVLGEQRRITIKEGRFEDHFRPYDVHLYAIATDCPVAPSGIMAT